jgi:hypothetical protein
MVVILHKNLLKVIMAHTISTSAEINSRVRPAMACSSYEVS